MAQKQKILVDKKVVGFQCIAVVAAINKVGEVVDDHIVPDSIDKKEFIKFLRKLFRQYKGKSLNIYLDNLGVHRAPEVRELCEENDS